MKVNVLSGHFAVCTYGNNQTFLELVDRVTFQCCPRSLLRPKISVGNFKHILKPIRNINVFAKAWTTFS